MTKQGMHPYRLYASLLLACSALGTAWAADSSASLADKAAPKQPIPFSHKLHVSQGLQCQYCHAMKAPGDFAGMPDESTCMLCHSSVKADRIAIQELARFQREEKSVPWERVYRIPNYVYFSHRVHNSVDGVSCTTCHGPVAERDVLALERSTSMAECMKCHDQYKASNDCTLCHDSH